MHPSWHWWPMCRSPLASHPARSGLQVSPHPWTVACSSMLVVTLIDSTTLSCIHPCDLLPIQCSRHSNPSHSALPTTGGHLVCTVSAHSLEFRVTLNVNPINALHSLLHSTGYQDLGVCRTHQRFMILGFAALNRVSGSWVVHPGRSPPLFQLECRHERQHATSACCDIYWQ